MTIDTLDPAPYVSDDEWRILVDPPRFSMSDEGTAWWPPEGFNALDVVEFWPWCAEVWERWAWPEDRIKHRAWQREIRWEPTKLAGRVCPVPVALRGDWKNPRWIWEGLGFLDLWIGNKAGQWHALDPRQPNDRQWEADSLELGSHAADWWRNCRDGASA